MREVGIDISGHTSHHLSEYITQQFDFVITVCDNAAENCPVFPGATTKLHWPYDDPDKATGTEEQVIGEFRRVRDAIRLRIAAWVATTVTA
jgi:arsenate reductase